LAYDVLSFNCLYWDSRAPILPADDYWQDSYIYASPPPPIGIGLPGLPAAVLMELTVYADPKPIDKWQPGDPVRTLTLRTIVNIEPVIQDGSFP